MVAVMQPATGEQQEPLLIKLSHAASCKNGAHVLCLAAGRKVVKLPAQADKPKADT